jgi:hypothetical protein
MFGMSLENKIESGRVGEVDEVASLGFRRIRALILPSLSHFVQDKGNRPSSSTYPPWLENGMKQIQFSVRHSNIARSDQHALKFRQLISRGMDETITLEVG